jgi:hypothetical protein
MAREQQFSTVFQFGIWIAGKQAREVPLPESRVNDGPNEGLADVKPLA